MTHAAVLLCLVVGITDGDTLSVRCEASAAHQAQTLKVRLAEIDAPEKGQPYGAQSRMRLASLCFGKSAEVRPQSHDRYGRTVARVSCDGVDASSEQVRTGQAWRFVRYSRDPLIGRYEAEARAAHLGLWADPGAVPPWLWRRARN